MRLALSLVALVLFAACAHAIPPARHLTLPPRSTPWTLSVTVLGDHVDELDAAVTRAFEANPELVRVARTHGEGHVDITISTTGAPLVDAECIADTHVVAYRTEGGPAVLDETAQQTEQCQFHSGALDAVRAQAVAWALERAVAGLASP